MFRRIIDLTNYLKRYNIWYAILKDVHADFIYAMTKEYQRGVRAVRTIYELI